MFVVQKNKNQDIDCYKRISKALQVDFSQKVDFVCVLFLDILDEQ